MLESFGVRGRGRYGASASARSSLVSPSPALSLGTLKLGYVCSDCPRASVTLAAFGCWNCPLLALSERKRVATLTE